MCMHIWMITAENGDICRALLGYLTKEPQESWVREDGSALLWSKRGPRPSFTALL